MNMQIRQISIKRIYAQQIRDNISFICSNNELVLQEQNLG